MQSYFVLLPLPFVTYKLMPSSSFSILRGSQRSQLPSSHFCFGDQMKHCFNVIRVHSLLREIRHLLRPFVLCMMMMVWLVLFSFPNTFFFLPHLTTVVGNLLREMILQSSPGVRVGGGHFKQNLTNCPGRLHVAQSHRGEMRLVRFQAPEKKNIGIRIGGLYLYNVLCELQ